MPDTPSVATSELLQVLFYKIYTTPRRYASNVRLIFAVKTMLALDDDAFRRMCEDLDEASLRAAIPDVMKRSLDGLEKELAQAETSPELARFETRPTGELAGAEKLALALLYLDAGGIPRAVDLLEDLLDADRSDGRAWMLLAEAHLIASALDEAESACERALAARDLPLSEREILVERLAALRLESADELYVREVFALAHLEESRDAFAKERFEAAARSAEHAVRIMPGSYEALLTAGCAWHRAGDTARAERCFEQSLVIMEMPILVSNF